MNPAQEPSSDNSTSEARRLLESWDRLSRAHTMIGAGCSCGIGGVVVALGDFEHDIVDYLQAEAERLDRPDVLRYLGEQAREGDSWSISKLLGGLTQPRDSRSHELRVGTFLLERLSRTLESFEKLHGSK
jgi:hypothetical protein